MDISGLRAEYRDRPFGMGDAGDDPFAQFSAWFSEACEGGVGEPNAMVLATATPEGRPSSRTLLLKRFDREGFAFFTNYESRKARELSANPYGSMTFFWRPLNRQVVVEGGVGRLPKEASQGYFRERPRGSQLAAWASMQDEVISSREALKARFTHFEKVYEGRDVPCPDYWGGYLLVPNAFEFWQGRPNRLHDRIRYLKGDGDWVRERLMP